MFEKISYYYMLGIYKEKHIKKLLDAGALTSEQYNILLSGGD